MEHPGVIDLLAHDPEGNEVLLGMIEPRPWDGSELQLFQLQEKLNAYMSFALDGEMVESFPELAGKPLRLLLQCVEPPDAMAQALIDRVREQIAFQGIRFDVSVVGDAEDDDEGCGSGCGCHS